MTINKMPPNSLPTLGPTRRAAALRDGDVVGVVAPARWLHEHELAIAPAALLGRRFAVRLAPQLALRLHQFAGSDVDRARGIEAMFADPAVKAILCAKGGYGAPRIVDQLDYRLIAANPKRFVGYSDMTALLLAIAQRAGLETYHGPMLVDVATGLDDTTKAHLVATLTDAPAPAAADALLRRASVLRAGSARGRLIGGNLTLLANMLGTPTDFDTAGAIFFLEDVGEPLYNIDRMLVHLKRAGKFDAIAALVIGEMRDLEDSATVPFGATVEQMAVELAGDRAIPIVANFPCGHTPFQLTLPIGAMAHLACTAERISAFAVD
jgi:muramoyltetrapeptide carboxypeptidase